MNDLKMMKLALEEAKAAFEMGEVPVGAVLCNAQGEIIATAHNECETTNDPTAHAEILVIQRGCSHLQNWRLTDCTLYVTVEPCPMCAGAIFQSRLTRLVYGTTQSQTGACESVFNIVNHPYLCHQTTVRAGVLEDDCRELMQKFFSSKRIK